MKKEKWNPNDWQGRRKEQVEGHAIGALISIVGFMVMMLFFSFFVRQMLWLKSCGDYGQKLQEKRQVKIKKQTQSQDLEL